MSILCTGFPSIDHIAQVYSSGRRQDTRTIVRHWPEPTMGGCPSNIAVGLSRLGQKAGVAFAMGDDEGSQWYLKRLSSEGVHTDQVRCLPDKAAARCYLFADQEGLSELYFDPGANQGFIPELKLDGVELLVVTVGPAEATQAYFAMARAANTPVAWQLKQDPRGIPDHLLGECLAGSRMLFANNAEIGHLMEVLGVDSLKQVLNFGPEVLVITLGAEGSRIYTAKQDLSIPKVPAQAIESTGAGDAYAAGFLYGYTRQEPLEVCGRIGAVVASFVVEHWGCQAGLPTLDRMISRYQLHFGLLAQEVKR